MTKEISNNDDNQKYSSVRETVRKFNMLGKMNNSSSIPIKFNNNTHSSLSISSTSRSTTTECSLSPKEIEQQKILSNEIIIIPQISSATINLQPNTYQKRPSIQNKSQSDITYTNNESESNITYASPSIIYKDEIISKETDSDDIGLEIIESVVARKQTINNNDAHDTLQYSPAIIDHYGENDIQEQQEDLFTPSPFRPPPPPPSVFALQQLQEESNNQSKRSLPLTNFLLEIGALVVVFILCMVLVLAIRENQSNLRTTMQIVYTYSYLVSILWMIWCAFDIIKFRKQWMELTSSAHDQEEYMDIVERHPHSISYFPDIHNTGGLFMRVGAGLLCMGSVFLTVIELAKAIEMMRTSSKTRDTLLVSYSQSVLVAKSITYIFRFFFHCIQFTFLFRYGNIVIDRYHLIAKIGLIHIIIANFSTWFEAIVIETLEELHKNSRSEILIKNPLTTITTTTNITNTITSKSGMFVRAATEPSKNTTTTNALEFIEKIESSLGVYLYPCLIEYSLISVTVFYIMWRNVGKTEKRSFLHFGDRHIFTVNCSRASHGLLIGGIILLLTIGTLIPDYILEPTSAVPITHITELILLSVSLLIVSILFVYTTKLYYDRQAHVDIFDEILILITTVGDFAYSFFGLFASIFIESYKIKIPRVIEIFIGLLAILQTFLQSGFILDTLKRRSTTKNEIRKKPGRELITALLLINLAIWMHDSLSAKKVRLNPLQVEYYDGGTWSIIQAFTSPLSIFYRFHSSVCLADIWHEVYHDHGNHNGKNGKHRLPITNNVHNH